MNNNLAQANILLLQLRADFLAELPEKLDRCESLMISMADAGDFLENYAALFRIIHSLKGSAGTHGIMTISFICHQLEDYLTGLSDKSRADDAQINILLEYLDLMRRTLELARQNTASFADIDKQLDALRQRSKHGKLSVLIVEENMYMQEIMKSSLDGLAVEVSIKADGLDALQVLLKIKFDVLITSAQAKSLNGIALLYALRASAGINHKIKTIIVTSKTQTVFAPGLAPNYLINKDQDISQHIQSAMRELISQD